MNKRGEVVRRVPGSFGHRVGIEALELSPDRRHAYVPHQLGTLVLEDALGELDIVSHRHVQVIATGIQAVAAAWR